MGFLKEVNQKADFETGIQTLSEGSKNGSKNTLRLFYKFCEEQGSTIEEAIQEMKIVKDRKNLLTALQSWVNWLVDQGLASSSIPVYFSHLRTFLYYHGILISDQERKREIKYPKITEDEKHGLSLDEIKGILETAGHKKKALYLMLLSSGMRIGEAVQLRKEDLELVGENFQITVRGKTTKTKKGRICFMSKEATRLVMPYWKKADGVIFGTNEDLKTAKSAENMRFDDYRKKAGFTKRYDYSKRYHLTLHSFRAYFITKVSRHDHNLAKRLAGQKGYLDQYDRMTVQEKLKLYKNIEPDLFIYEQRPESEEIQELKEKLEKTEKMAQKQKQRLDNMDREDFLVREMARLDKLRYDAIKAGDDEKVFELSKKCDKLFKEYQKIIGD